MFSGLFCLHSCLTPVQLQSCINELTRAAFGIVFRRCLLFLVVLHPQRLLHSTTSD